MLVVAAVILVIQGYRPFPPSLLGKSTTFFEIALLFSPCWPRRMPMIAPAFWRTIWVHGGRAGDHFRLPLLLCRARRLHTS